MSSLKLNQKLLKKLRLLIKDLSHKTSVEQSINLLYDIATRDPKTKLYNYRFFENVLDIEIEEAKRGKKICLAFIDLDHFKSINAKYGHIKADAILKEVAKKMTKTLRKTDVLARFGGEEFVICLTNISLDKAKIVCERIRKRIENKWKNEVTLSMGLTAFREKDTRETFENRATQLLLKAKNSGRNLVVAE
jgi:diguanylate cyclase (GGDEF)-like protein